MMTVLKADFDQLRAQLEDTQASLAAAFARIEAFRLREKLLVQEIAKLRLGDSVENLQIGSTDAPSTHPTSSGSQGQQKQREDNSQDGAAEQSQPTGPYYITEMADQPLPILFVNGGRKSPGSVVVTSTYIDFVEIRARVKQEDFLGFTSAPFAVKKSQLLPSCLSATPETVDELPGGAGASVMPYNPTPSPLPASPSPQQFYNSSSLGISGAGGATPPSYSPSSPPGVNFKGRRHSWGSGNVPRSPQGLAGSRGEGSEGGGSGSGLWQVLWTSGGVQQQLLFEATQETRELLHKHTQRWLSGHHGDDGGEELAPRASTGAPTSEEEIELAVPRHLSPASGSRPRLSEPSTLLDPSCIPLLANALPGRLQHRDWTLAYSTARHGISLSTLFRKAAGAGSSVLVVRDAGGHVFGAFTAEHWRLAPRFYGTGETFVFQLEPHRVMFPWKVKSSMKNDFFMYATPECLAVGGLGHFAIWLDQELLRGSSGRCGTFGSPCLAAKEDFKIQGVELWGLG